MTQSQTLLLFAPAEAHDLPDHPESAERALAIQQLFQQEEIWQQVELVAAVPASHEQIHRAHNAKVTDTIYRISTMGGGLIGADTYLTDATYDLAALAAGGCCQMVDEIVTGNFANGFAIVRPPGHHAERNRVSGFCLFNNVAIAAKHAQAVHGVQKVLIVDIDVHHGNGTQDIFYTDPSVLFVSTHLYLPMYFYPGTGASYETGRDAGKGYTVNVPLPPYVGDKGYNQLFTDLILPKVDAFRPELILVSIGFDAHWADPLAQAGLTLTGYARLTRLLLDMAHRHCAGKILFVLEGGYGLKALAYGSLNVVHALLGRDPIHDPLGPMPHPETEIARLLQELKKLHL